MPSLGDVFRITAFQTLLTEQCLNVYFYVVDEIGVIPPSVGDIDLAFRSDVLVPMRDIQASQVNYDLVRTENLMDPSEFSDNPQSGITGTVTGSVLPSYAAWSLLMRRTTKLTRNGSKRIPGVLEEWLTNGSFSGVSLSLDNALAALAVQLIDPSMPPTWTLTPVIVGRNPDGTLDLTRLNVVRAGEYRGPSTQNTRKQLV